MLWLREWVGKVPVPLALSSGNHDGNEPNLSLEPSALSDLAPDDGEIVLRALTAERWMDIMDAPTVHTDNRSQVVQTGRGDLVVSSIPYSADPADHEGLWVLGRHLRVEHRCPWIVLHHDPPHGADVGGTGGNMSLRWQILQYQPDYVLSGHLHHQPYKGWFAEKMKRTWCFNPGFAKKTPPDHLIPSSPNHIVLDTKKGFAQWHATWEGETIPRIGYQSLA